jgi:antitoxin HicB
MKYHFKVHKEGIRFWAQCLELAGCITQASSQEELEKNMQDALNLYIEEEATSSDLAAMPNNNIKLSKSVVEVFVDPQVAFTFLVRYWRIQHGLTQKEAAQRMGFDKLYSYQRLEARRCNPSLKIITMVKKIYPEFSLDSAITTRS